MGLDMDALRQKLGELNRKGSRTNVLWKPKEGSTTIRIVPWSERPDNPFVELYFHYLGGRTTLSPLTFDEPDPIMEFCQELRAGGGLSKEEWSETRKFEAKPRTFVPVIVRGEEDRGVRWWGFGKTIFKELLAVIDDPEYGDITHPKTGRDIKVTFVPKEKSPTSFPQTSIRVSPNRTPISDDKEFLKKVLTEQPDIYEAYNKPTYDELKKKLDDYLAPVAEEDDDDDDWGTPDTSGSPTVASKAPVSKAIEEEFDDIFNDDD